MTAGWLSPPPLETSFSLWASDCVDARSGEGGCVGGECGFRSRDGRTSPSLCSNFFFLFRTATVGEIPLLQGQDRTLPPFPTSASPSPPPPGILALPLPTPDFRRCAPLPARIHMPTRPGSDPIPPAPRTAAACFSGSRFPPSLCCRWCWWCRCGYWC